MTPTSSTKKIRTKTYPKSTPSLPKNKDSDQNLFQKDLNQQNNNGEKNALNVIPENENDNLISNINRVNKIFNLSEREIANKSIFFK